MLKNRFWKKAVSCTLIAGLTVSVAACSGKKTAMITKQSRVLRMRMRRRPSLLLWEQPVL